MILVMVSIELFLSIVLFVTLLVFFAIVIKGAIKLITYYGNPNKRAGIRF